MRGQGRRAGLVAAALSIAAVVAASLAYTSSPAAAEDSWHVVAPAGATAGVVDQMNPGWFSFSDLDSGTYPVSYRREDDGSVRVRGLAMSSGVDTVQADGQSTAAIFRLPCGYRPASRTTASVSLLRVTPEMQPVGVEAGLLSVQPAGSVAIISPELASSGTFRGAAVLDFVLEADKLEFPGTSCDDRLGTTIYAAPESDPGVAGGHSSSLGVDEADPTTFIAALVRAVPGDHILLRGGQYDVESTWRFDDLAGTVDDPVLIANYPGEQPVFDGSGMAPYVHEDPFGYKPMLQFTGARWLEVTGLEVQNSSFKGIDCTDCRDTRWANLNIHHNAEAGFVLYDAEGTADESARNTFIDSDFHHNHDSWFQGEESDGLNIWNVRGEGNKIVRCRFFDNADDGLEMLDTEVPVVVVDSWSFRNGLNQWFDVDGYASADFKGDGSGFGLGGAGTGSPDPIPPETYKPTPIVPHVVARSLAWDNTQGFKSNGNGGQIQAYHNTAMDNRELGFHFFKLGWPDPTFTYDARNNISVGPGSLGLFSEDLGSNVLQGINTWDHPTLDAAVEDLDTSQAERSIAEGPRPFVGPGNLPVTTFLRPLPGSGLIDIAATIPTDPSDPAYPPYPDDPDGVGHPDHVSWVFPDDYGALEAQ